jgi:hypothetical protein
MQSRRAFLIGSAALAATASGAIAAPLGGDAVPAVWTPGPTAVCVGDTIRVGNEFYRCVASGVIAGRKKYGHSNWGTARVIPLALRQNI